MDKNNNIDKINNPLLFHKKDINEKQEPKDEKYQEIKELKNISKNLCNKINTKIDWTSNQQE